MSVQSNPVTGDIASVFLFNHKGEVLFQHRDAIPTIVRPDMWVPPGGHCEEGETREQSALREFFEETGYRCKTLRLLGTWDDPVEDRVYRLHLFWDTYDEVSPIHCFEGQELRFLRRSEALHFLIPELVINLWDFAVAVRNRENIQSES